MQACGLRQATGHAYIYCTSAQTRRASALNEITEATFGASSSRLCALLCHAHDRKLWCVCTAFNSDCSVFPSLNRVHARTHARVRAHANQPAAVAAAAATVCASKCKQAHAATSIRRHARTATSPVPVVALVVAAAAETRKVSWKIPAAALCCCWYCGAGVAFLMINSLLKNLRPTINTGGAACGCASMCVCG